jgi:branched-chain amino acid transport system substrate-binding protein
MNRKGVGAVAALSGIMLFLTGCSDDGADASGEPKVSSTLTGTPVVLGVISDDSGANGATGDASETARAWAAYTNANGGLNGHPVKVVVKDTQSSAANALQAAQDLVENEGAIAIADNTFSNTAFAKYATEKKVPVIGMNTGAATTQYLSDPNFFTPTPSVLTVLQGLPKAASLLNKKAFSFLYCAEIAACGQAVPIVEGGAKAAGMTAPYSASFSASSPNYTAQCLAAKKAGVDTLFAGGSVPASNKRVYDDCAKQGYQPLAAFSVSTINQSVIEDDLIPHLVGVTAVRPWFMKDVPGALLFHKVMGDYLPKSTSQPVVAAQWAALQLFAKAAASVGSAPSSEDIYAGLYGFKDETLDGLTVPFTFVKGKPSTSNCIFAYRGDEGELAPLNEGEPICVATP